MSRSHHTERNVRIEYGSVSLSDPGAVRYLYMLEGLDDGLAADHRRDRRVLSRAASEHTTPSR